MQGPLYGNVAVDVVARQEVLAVPLGEGALSPAGGRSPSRSPTPRRTMAPEDAAITIQRWWCGSRDESLTSLCLAFQSVGLTAAWAKSVPFDELALCLQRDDLLQFRESLAADQDSQQVFCKWEGRPLVG